MSQFRVSNCTDVRQPYNWTYSFVFYKTFQLIVLDSHANLPFCKHVLFCFSTRSNQCLIIQLSFHPSTCSFPYVTPLSSRVIGNITSDTDSIFILQCGKSWLVDEWIVLLMISRSLTSFELVWIVKQKKPSYWIEFGSISLRNPQYFISLISDIYIRSTVINLSGIGEIVGALTKISRAGVWREIVQSLKNFRTHICFIKHFLEPKDLRHLCPPISLLRIRAFTVFHFVKSIFTFSS